MIKTPYYSARWKCTSYSDQNSEEDIITFQVLFYPVHRPFPGERSGIRDLHMIVDGY